MSLLILAVLVALGIVALPFILALVAGCIGLAWRLLPLFIVVWVFLRCCT
jgi:hypothetical protein